MPTPYLATAPLPVSSMSQGRIDQLAGTSRSGMVLPSSYARPPLPQTHSSPGPSRPPDSAPSPAPTRRRKYAAGLLAPPAIMPGGQAATPRMQGQAGSALGPPLSSRRRSADRVGVGGAPSPVIIPAGGASGLGTASRRRSEDRLRDLGQVNSSVMSLGLLGQIMETDPTPEEAPVPPSGRRRRRVVRGEQGSTRRATVTSREEGLALGLARGASMRRTNVWDGEVFLCSTLHRLIGQIYQKLRIPLQLSRSHRLHLVSLRPLKPKSLDQQHRPAPIHQRAQNDPGLPRRLSNKPSDWCPCRLL